MIRWNTKIVLFKTEVTYGVDSIPTGAANAVLATDVVFSPMEGEDVSRQLETPWLGAQETLPASLHARLSFNVELQGSGTPGTPPAWGPLLRACGAAQVTGGGTVTYNKVSDTFDSATLYLWIGGTRYVSTGMRGTCRMEFTAQGIPYLRFEFLGLWTLPTDTTRATPTLTAFQRPFVANSARTSLTLAGTARVMRSFGLNLGNQLEPRFLVGSESIEIVDAADAVEMTLQAVPLSAFDPFTLARDGTTVAAVLTHGTVAGRIATLSIPRLQIQRPTGLTNAQGIVEWPLRGVPIPLAGNDQWTLTLT